LQERLLGLVQQLIRHKKFSRYLISHCYPIAIDGTQKLQREWLWTEQCLERQVQTKQEDGTVGTRPQYYVYVVEARLAFANGMTIPLFSDFLDYSTGEPGKNKQDFELKAIYRLAELLKENFPPLPAILSLDGVYEH